MVRRYRGSSQRKPARGRASRPFLPTRAVWVLLWQALFHLWLLWGTQASPQHGGGTRESVRNHKHPKGPRQRPLWVPRLLPPPATGYTGPARIQCGRATCSEHTGRGTHATGWLGRWHPRAALHHGGPRQGTEVSFRAALEMPAWPPGKQKQTGVPQGSALQLSCQPLTVKCSHHPPKVLASWAGLGRGSA